MITPAVIFPWNENFETGITIVDEQHQKLVELLNKLASHLAYGAATPLLESVLGELADYAVYHFQTEEAVWAQYLPADGMTKEHLKVHASFVDEVVKLKVELDQLESEQVIDDIVSFLTHWLAFHILESDKHMAKIVLGMQQGQSLQEAKSQANVEMSGAMRILIETILKMYDSLSSRTMSLMREIAERQRAEERLRLSKNVINSTLEAIFITDAGGLIIDTNPAFCLDVQHEHERLVGTDIRLLKPTLAEHGESADAWETARKFGHWTGEIRDRDAQGNIEVVWLSLSAVKDEKNEVTNFVGVLSSLSQLMEHQLSLEEAANHDPLTGLPNRRLLNDRLDQAFIRANRSGSMLAVCYLDLDGFKAVNDSLGHEAGDEVLRTVSLRLIARLRAEDTVARLGGDEFVILLGELHKIEDAKHLLDKILGDIALPISIGGDTQASVTASIGVVLHPHDNLDTMELLLHADKAMYVAKRAGKSRYHFMS